MTALRDMDLKLSIVDAICGIMQDSALWASAYTVYTEEDFASMARGNPPARPFVFVMAARREVEPRFLPIILVDMDIKRIPFQLGGLSRQVDIRLHIMARSEGEGEGIKDVIVSELYDTAIEFYSYPISIGDTVVTTQYCEPEWTTEVVPIPETYMNEGTLRYWTVTSGAVILP